MHGWTAKEGSEIALGQKWRRDWQTIRTVNCGADMVSAGGGVGSGEVSLLIIQGLEFNSTWEERVWAGIPIMIVLPLEYEWGFRQRELSKVVGRMITLYNHFGEQCDNVPRIWICASLWQSNSSARFICWRSSGPWEKSDMGENFIAMLFALVKTWNRRVDKWIVLYSFIGMHRAVKINVL